MTEAASAEADTPSATEAAPAEPVGWGPPLLLGVMFVGIIVASLAFASTFETEVGPVFEDPDDPTNPLLYLGLVLVFTLVILAIARLGLQWLIQLIILGAVWMTMVYVIWPLGSHYVGGGDLAWLGIGVVGAGALTFALWKYPEWYVVDAAGVLVGVGATALFGISFGLLPALLLLVAFAVYDFIAVYRTKHMIDLADAVLDLHLPVMLVAPKVWGYSFLEDAALKDRIKKHRSDAGDEGEDDADADGAADAADGSGTDGDDHEPVEVQGRDAVFMGLGDVIIPGVLVVSAFHFLDDASARVTGLPIAADLVVALATLVGALLGFGVLMWAVAKGKPHAGLPSLNGGALLGFFLTLLPLYGIAPLLP